MTIESAIFDVGTGYTKMGLSSNPSPQYIIPTVLGERNNTITHSPIMKNQGLADLDFFIGDEAIENQKTCQLTRFMDNGIVTDWEKMEKFYEQCYFRYLRINSEEHPVITTDTPFNTPENREYLAEIMFETFTVPKICIAVQPVLAMFSTMFSKLQTNKTLNGTVIDCGERVTDIIPVIDGSIVPSAIRRIPIGGADATKFVLDSLQERGEPMPLNEQHSEQHCFVTSNMMKHFDFFDQRPNEFFKTYDGINRVTKQPFSVDVGYERFLAPEIFFNPSLISTDFTESVPVLVDQAIQHCSVDSRRSLYGNICLSGGSSMFRFFGKRMEVEVQKLVNGQLATAEKLTGEKPPPIDVKVISTKHQGYGVFFGGSMIASSDNFNDLCRTKEQYEEYGPAICRPLIHLSTLV
ncbi:putative Actin B [Blattamonas nauphoetae]|uniref:Actin B n=1 Tax=Blattamonas nauphoetae TaxID=2049346 RepID=A0ABQ9XKT9_9EUKA|nr:putative Actin B [Blattamonas nauphoetae]